MRSTATPHPPTAFAGHRLGRSFIHSKSRIPKDLRKKSFEAEDGPSLMRSFSSSSTNKYRLSYNTPCSSSPLPRSSPPSYLDRRLLSLGDEAYHRKQPDSFFDYSSPFPSFYQAQTVEVKRNHSLKVRRMLPCWDVKNVLACEVDFV